MDGKKLYDYARSGTPLPRPIESRKCTVSALELVNFIPADSHTYTWPKEEVDRTDVQKMEALLKQSETAASEIPSASEPSTSEASTSETPAKTEEADVKAEEPTQETEIAEEAVEEPAAAFEITMTVSSGTYVRTIIHDIGLALGSAAHVVLLQRTRQGDFVVAKDEVELGNGQKRSVEWDLFKSAIEEKSNRPKGEKRSEALQPWEEEVLRVIEVV